jgi:hypothetical protein
MAPLVGLFVMASIFQVLFASDIASLCGALLGVSEEGVSIRTRSGGNATLRITGCHDWRAASCGDSGPYLYLPFLLQRHNFCGYAGSNSISWFQGCSVECGNATLRITGCHDWRAASCGDRPRATRNPPTPPSSVALPPDLVRIETPSSDMGQ